MHVMKTGLVPEIIPQAPERQIGHSPRVSAFNG